MANTPIIILNNLYLTGKQYITISNTKVEIPAFKPEFLSEGKVYTYDSTGNSLVALIIINKPIMAQGKLTDVLTHEFGHAVSRSLIPLPELIESGSLR